MDALFQTPLGFAGLAAACGVVFFGAVVQGSVGIGLGLVSAPLLILIDPRLVPGPLLFAALVLTLLVAHRERRAIDLRGVKWAVVGRLLGTVVAAGALVMIPQRGTSLIFATLVLLAVAMSVIAPALRLTTGTLLVAGALSGFMGTTASIGGPPMALLYQHAPGARLRGTLASFFVVGVILSLTALAAVGRFGGDELRWALALLPGIVTGFVISRRTVRLLDRGYTRIAVLVVSALAAVVVILREIS